MIALYDDPVLVWKQVKRYEESIKQKKLTEFGDRKDDNIQRQPSSGKRV